MKHERREINKDTGLVQITLENERWYGDDISKTYYPSSSWICSVWPKGYQLMKWIADNGWEESQKIKNEAGERGSNVHEGISLLLLNQELHIDNYSYEEWMAIMSFVAWWKKTKPTLLATEVSGINHEVGYGGTIDLICMINNELWVIDYKTSQSIYKEYELQISSYGELAKCIDIGLDISKMPINLGILQIGYKLNKQKYKFKKIENQMDLFLSAKKIWAEENKNQNPRQIEMPITLSISINK